MNELLPLVGHWFWLIAAGILLFLELMAPGMFFIWLAGAAIVTGAVDLLLPMSWQTEAVVFASLSVVSAFLGRSYLKSRSGGRSEQPNLNRRMHDYVGKSYVLDYPIANGSGQITIEGTIWRVRGEDAPKGARVKVTGVDGMQLVVSAE